MTWSKNKQTNKKHRVGFLPEHITLYVQCQNAKKRSIEKTDLADLEKFLTFRTLSVICSDGGVINAFWLPIGYLELACITYRRLCASESGPQTK